MRKSEQLPAGGARSAPCLTPGVPSTAWRALCLSACVVASLVASIPIVAAPFARDCRPHEGMRFAVLSDTHLYDARLGTSGSAFFNYLIQNPNLAALSEPIFEATLADIKNRHVRFVIISGDLTKDGEVVDHPLEDLRIVACHLGTGGSSVAAIRNGHSIDTSMGYTPLPGLMMSTRCGDLDPMLAIYLIAEYGYRSEELIDLFSRKSGLLGISGFSSDITDIIARLSGKEKEQAVLALNMYVHRLRKYVGSYVVALGGINTLIFTDDIGVKSSEVRARVCENMKWCGVELDPSLNVQADPRRICSLNSPRSKTRILSIPTNEELVICMEGVKLLGKNHDSHL